MTTVTIPDLPSELLMAIFLHLDPLSAIKCRAVCKDWKSLGKSTLFMRTLCQHLGFLLPGQSLSSLRKPKRRLRGSHLAWSNLHGRGQLRGLRGEDLASYDLFFKASWKLQRAWPTPRVHEEARESSSTTVSAELAAPRSTVVAKRDTISATATKAVGSVASSSSSATDRPSLLKMYSTNLSRYTFTPGSAYYDRVEDCLVTTEAYETVVAAIDARNGGYMSHQRSKRAEGYYDETKLECSDGWILYATGPKEIVICRFERLNTAVQEPRRGFLRRFRTLQIPHKIHAYRFHFPTLMVATEDFHCLVYDVRKKDIAGNILLSKVPVSPQSTFSCVDFDAEHIAVLYDHRTQSEGGATKISGFVQIYARSNGDCLWTCSAVALPAISSLFNLNPLEGDRRSRDNGKSRWSVSSVTPRTSGDHPSPTTHSKLYDVKFDERTASLLLLARNHLYIMLGVKAQCAVALASAHQDDFNFASALTTLCFSPSANRELGEKLAVHDGRAAFVAWNDIVIMDIEAVVRSVTTDASQLSPSAVYIHRLPHLIFVHSTSLQMDATSLTAVGHYNGLLIRKDTYGGRTPEHADPEEKTTYSLKSAPWQRELGHPLEMDEPILEKVLVFNFGQLAAQAQGTSSQEGSDKTEKATVLCYPSGRDLCSLRESGHMIMDPYEGTYMGGDFFDDDFSPDEDTLFELMYDESEDEFVLHGMHCRCGDE